MGCFKKVAGIVLPQLGAVGGAANGFLQGGGVSGALKGAVQSGLMTAGEMLGGPVLGEALGVGPTLATGIGGAIGGAAGQGITGGNVLSGALQGGLGGLTTGSLVNGGLSDLLGHTGLSNLFSGSEMPAISAPSIADSATSGVTAAGADTGTGSLSNFLPSGGAPAAGGGTPGGFFNYDLSGNPLETAGSAGAGVGAQPATGLQSLFDSPSTGGFNYDISGSPAGASTYSIPQQFTNAAAPAAGGNVNILSQLFNGGSNPGTGLGSSLLKGGLSALLSKTPTNQYNNLANAYTEAGQNYQPFLTAGTNANNTLADLYGTNGQAAAQAATQNWQNTPGYQFQRDQGIQALDASAAARGGAISGNNIQAIQRYGTGLADQYYQQYLNNLQKQAAEGLPAAQGVGTGQVGASQAGVAGKGLQDNQYNTILAQMLSGINPNVNLSSLFGA